MWNNEENTLTIFTEREWISADINLASAIWPEVRTVDRVYIFAEPQARQMSTRSTVRTEGHITS